MVCMTSREQYGWALSCGGIAAIPTSIIGMLDSIHERCDDCHDILTGVSFYTSPWFGRFAFLLPLAVLSLAMGRKLLAPRRTFAPGWYADPWNQLDALRYWNGVAWTGYVTAERNRERPLR
jgi:hypothetical protein